CTRLALLHQGRIRFQGSPIDFVRAARGETWEFYGDHKDVEIFSGRSNLVSIREDMKGICFRVISPTPPRDTARNVTPSLEDAYVHFLESGALAA
ncbi:MAG: hypothetical protein ACP5I1_11450, partial [Candidatus Hinthialibacter sp.]